MLTRSAAENINLAIFQLAHEAIYLLSLLGRQNELVLEEGLAT